MVMSLKSARSIEGVLFDLDNTLANRTGAFRIWAEWLVDDQVTRRGTDEFAVAVRDLEEFDAGGYCPRDEFAAKVLARFPQMGETPDAFVVSFQAALVRFLPPLTADCVEFLERLKATGIPWGIVTNGGPNQLRKIDYLGLDAMASCVFVSGIIGVRKPEAAIFVQAAEALGVSPESVLFVGDHPEADIVGAARVGMMTAWLPHGTTWPAEYHDLRPDHTITTIGELLTLVR